MSMMRLTPDECHHCDVARREASTSFEFEGASPDWINARLANTLCREHQAEKEARERRERRRITDQRRRAQQRGR